MAHQDVARIGSAMVFAAAIILASVVVVLHSSAQVCVRSLFRIFVS
jgi:hypothetical protein